MVQKKLNPKILQISYHDPDGHVFEVGGRLLRKVSFKAASRLIKFLDSQLAADLIAENKLPATRQCNTEELLSLGVDVPDDSCIWFEHERVKFVSYSHEWIPEMLLAAAELTLELARRLNADGWDLKDASSSNVAFVGTRPIFVDLCSIVERNNDPYWRPKGQFERHFVLPLMAYVYRGLMPHHVHSSNADGLDPAALINLLGLKKWTNVLCFKHCTLPLMISRAMGRTSPPRVDHIDSRASDVARRWQLRSLARSLSALRRKLPKPASEWFSYTSERGHYSSMSLLEKRETVERWLKATSPDSILDLGANTGEFSFLAARVAARVLAFEKDLDSARLAFLFAKGESINCQVILQDIGNPSPARGWRYTEKKSINERLFREVDCVLALALIHHLLVSAGIPLGEVLSQLAQWTNRFAVIEYVPPSDPLFKLICDQRNVDFSWLDIVGFRAQLARHFSIIEEVPFKHSKRTLFFCERSTW